MKILIYVSAATVLCILWAIIPTNAADNALGVPGDANTSLGNASNGTLRIGISQVYDRAGFFPPGTGRQWGVAIRVW